jgi:malate synthase
MEAFSGMTGPNQLDRMPERVPGAAEMLAMHEGARTEAGARENIRVGVQYLAAWLSGKGAVPLYNLMEDAATAEICRTQLWQWLKLGATLDDGRKFDRTLFEQLWDEELGALPDQPNLTEAAGLMRNMILADKCEEFLTLPAYPLLN